MPALLSSSAVRESAQCERQPAALGKKLLRWKACPCHGDARLVWCDPVICVDSSGKRGRCLGGSLAGLLESSYSARCCRGTATAGSTAVGSACSMGCLSWVHGFCCTWSLRAGGSEVVGDWTQLDQGHDVIRNQCWWRPRAIWAGPCGPRVWVTP